MKRLAALFSLQNLPVILGPIVLLGPVFLTSKVLFWGTPALQFVPWWSYAWQTLLSGHLPLWNPLSGMGAPLIANYQSGIFYPPSWTYLFLYLMGGVPLMAWGQAVLVVFHLTLSGLGMARLAQRLGLGPLAQAVAGLAFGLSGYLVARAGFLSINAAVAWLPWILLCLTPYPAADDPGEILHHQSISSNRKQFLLLVFFLALQLLAGHAQVTWYTWILCGLWVVYWSLSPAPLAQAQTSRGDAQISLRQRLVLAPRRLGLAGGWLALAIILAFGLAAVQLLPTAEYLGQSQRASAVAYEAAMTYSFWPWRLITLFAPGFFGNPAQGDYWGYANYWEDAIYVGLLPLLMALGAIFNRRSGSLRWFLLALFGLGLLLALGKNTPVFPWLYLRIPTFALFQAPARYMIWGVFALALLAALGVENWRRPEGRGLYWTRLGSAGAFAVSLGAGLAWYFMGDISPSFIRATTIAGVLGLVSGMLSLVAPVREDDLDSPGDIQEAPKTSVAVNLPQPAYPLWAWQWGVALFVAADLVLAGWGLNPGVSSDIYRPAPAVSDLRARLAGQRLYLSGSDEYALKYNRFLRFDTFDPGEDWRNLRAVMLPNLNMLDGLASVNNFDPLVPGRYAAWMEFLDGLDSRVSASPLRMMGVGLVETTAPGAPVGVSFDPLLGGQRARWVPCAIIVSDASQAWKYISGWQVDFSSEVLLEDPERTPGASCPSDAPRQGVPALVSQSRPDKVELQVTAPGDGWLVLSDTWYPGWQAWLDGRRVDILPANSLFRAIPVPAGTHSVVFRYQPVTFYLGAVLSFAALLLFFYLWRRWRVPVDE